MAERRSRVPLWLRITLALSLAANLAVVGLIAGAALSRGGPPFGAGPPGAGPFALVRALPLDERRALIRDLREGRGRPDRAERRQRINALIDLIRAEPFDRDAVQAMLSDQRDRAAVETGRVEDAVLDRLSAMDPAARAAFAERLAETGRPDRERRDSGREDR